MRNLLDEPCKLISLIRFRRQGRPLQIHRYYHRSADYRRERLENGRSCFDLYHRSVVD